VWRRGDLQHGSKQAVKIGIGKLSNTSPVEVWEEAVERCR
jgi:hypothetical protein